MVDRESNARRFLDAFADIEGELARQQGKRDGNDRFAPFGELVEGARNLIPKHRDSLKRFAALRNAISHNRYRNGTPIADPRDDTVEEIERIRELVFRPPRLTDAIKMHGIPHIFSPEDDVRDFLKLVTDHDFSQAPVEVSKGNYRLLTTNAVARWFAHDLEAEGGLLDSVSIRHVLEYSEIGDRLQSVKVAISTARAINIFSGLVSSKGEPPAALLVMGIPGQGPQRLAVRADLAVLYAQLGE